METSYIYPNSLYYFTRGVVYQVLDPVTEDWSEDKVISKMCYSTKDYLSLLIKRKGVRIKTNENRS